ncbi:hypothetical protein ACPRNU_21360 [Chromobacterium vaccinii]|uniref:hypothetical protein n=1 Tax=Chromobacterium vaccinii TaxID=1108595 RepID=UPI003C7457D5
MSTGIRMRGCKNSSLIGNTTIGCDMEISDCEGAKVHDNVVISPEVLELLARIDAELSKLPDSDRRKLRPYVADLRHSVLQQVPGVLKKLNRAAELASTYSTLASVIKELIHHFSS